MAVTRLNREYHAMLKSPNPQIVVRPDPKNCFTWHYVLHGLPDDTPYAGGVYHGKLVFPQTYPFAPPSIYILTPNGRFDVNTRLCLSMSDFHPESWNPSWRTESILQGMLSFMLDPTEPRTTGGVITSKAYKERAALNSFLYNCKQKVFGDLFPEFTDESKYDPEKGFILGDMSSSPPDSDSTEASNSVSKRSTQMNGPESNSDARGDRGNIFPFLWFLRAGDDPRRRNMMLAAVAGSIAVIAVAVLAKVMGGRHS